MSHEMEEEENTLPTHSRQQWQNSIDNAQKRLKRTLKNTIIPSLDGQSLVFVQTYLTSLNMWIQDQVNKTNKMIIDAGKKSLEDAPNVQE